MIHIKNVSFSYHTSTAPVLEHINLDLARGEYLSVMGENGSGKTTLMRLLLKMLRPIHGSLNVETKNIGYVPQRMDHSNLDFPITVMEALDSYRRLKKISDKSVMRTHLDRVGMADYGDALIGTLSGGQSQKIYIARALIGDPELLILDEPSTGVDRKSQVEIYQLLKQINVERKMTIVSVEHNLEAAIAHSTLIYHLSNGRGHLCTPQNYASEFLMGKGKEVDFA